MSRGQIGPWWRAEKHRHFLFFSAMPAIGIAAYFALGSEPNWHALLAALAAIVSASVILGRRHAPLRPFLLILCLVLAGLTWAATYTAQQHLTVLDHAMNPRPVTGIVHDVERTEAGLRITLDEVVIENLEPEKTPERVRLSLRLKSDAPFPEVGQRITLLAGLLPPMGPAMPHGFDFARYFFFRGIGAVGYGLPPWQAVDACEVPPPGRGRLGGGLAGSAPDNPGSGSGVPLPASREGSCSSSSLADRFANWRIRLTERIIGSLGPVHGPIAAGLITGEDRAIAEADYDALKASNLYHIIAISGGHMVVISGILFLLMRWLTLCLPGWLRYRPEMKSIAAAATLLLTTLYLFVTGLPVSAVRAYLMIALVLLAVIFRRQPDPMRSLAVAALIMLALDPSDLFEPGFQLSFVATLAIIALVEQMFLRHHPDHSWPVRILRLFLASTLITVVAEAATTPFVIAQFNMFGTYGVLANMLATPLVSLFVMPVVALFFLLLPFGLEGWALWALDYGIRALLWIAHEVASLPHAQWFFPSLPGWGVALVAIGLLWFCFFTQRPRWLGIPLVLAGILSLTTVTLPDLLVGQEVKQIALRTPDGYALARGRADSMLPELWANGLGYKQLPTVPRGDAAWRCDKLGCIAAIDGTRIAFPENGLALDEDCTRANLIITRLKKVRCEQTPVIDYWNLYRGGSYTVWVNPLRLESSAERQGKRPWSAN